MFNKLISKKFIGWIGACVFLYIDKISENTWLFITLAYMGIETGLNILDKIKTIKEEVK